MGGLGEGGGGEDEGGEGVGGGHCTGGRGGGGAGGAEVQEVVTGVSGPLGWKMAEWMRISGIAPLTTNF